MVSVPLSGSVTPNAWRRSAPDGDLRQDQVAFWSGAAMSEDGTHRVHLGVTGAAVAAGALDLLEDRATGRERQAAAAIGLRDQRGEKAGLRERAHELFRIGAGRVLRAPVGAGEGRAQAAHRIPDVPVILRLASRPRPVYGPGSGQEPAPLALACRHESVAC